MKSVGASARTIPAWPIASLGDVAFAALVAGGRFLGSWLNRVIVGPAVVHGLGLLLTLFALVGFCGEARAQFATGGTGLYRDSIFWVDFGNNGENVFAGRTITRSFNVGTPASAANLLSISCTLSNAVAVGGTAGLRVYTPGSWQGDGLDELYNIGGNHPGTGTNPNTLSIGLATNSASEVEFDLSCSATLGGNPFPLSGLVFADAEASGSSEFVAAELTSGGTLRVIDQISQCGQQTSVSATGTEVRFTGPATSCQNNSTPSLRAGPALVGFIEGATSARVIARGGGVSAVAVGAMIDLEYSESIPSSYGVASHILSPVWSGGLATTGVNYHNPANLATRSFGVRLGANLAADQNASGPVDGPDVDALPTTSGELGGGYADVTAPSGAPGSAYSISNVACVGPAAVAGWIDFNGNGSFEANERSATATCPSGSGNVTLNWTLPADFAPRSTSFMRLRAGTNASDIASPAGVAADGETEDYRLALVPASLTLVKLVDNSGGGTAGAGDFTLQATGPTPISGTSGSAAVTNAPVNIGTYALSETNLPGYSASAYTCTINGGSAVAGNQITLAEGDEAVCTVTNSFSPITISVAKSASPAEGATVFPGQTISYTLTATIAGGSTSQVLTLNDAVGSGLRFGSVTSAGSFSCSGSLSCQLPAGTAPGTYSVIYTALVAPGASGTVTNAVTATNPPGGDPDPSCTDCAVSHQVQPGYDFCAVEGPIFNVVNGVNIWRLTPPGGPDAQVAQLTDAAVAGNLNGLMVDPVRNRLLLVSRSGDNTILWAYDVANGGWYQATTFASPDFPRAAMNHQGVGFLVSGGASPEVWRVTANPTGFGYTAQLMGSLSYDFAPTDPGSGDIAFDGSGIAWLSAGQDLYHVNLTAGSLTATRQTRPLLNGSPSTIQWAGIAFGGDGRLYMANNSAPSRYYAYDPATGTLTQVVATGAGGSRDLASCFFPLIAPPSLSVSKALAEVNGAAYTAGAPVQPGDTLTYRISITNSGGSVATLFPGEVVEAVPANTSFVAAGSNFTCTASGCSNNAAVNVPGNGGTVTLDFVVRVDNPLTASVATIDNAVIVEGVDCSSAGNDCSESTPVGPTVSVAKSADPIAGSSVTAGATINYTLTVTVANSAITQPVTLTDTLDSDLTFGSVTNSGPFTCSGSLSCVLPAGTLPGTYAVTYSATVDADATGTVGNSVTATNPPGGDPEPTCASCTTQHPIVAAAVSVAKTANPADGSTVAPGDTISYTLTATVANSATTEAVTLTDTLDADLTFGSVTSAGPFSCSGSLSCVLPAGTLPGTYSVTYTATVDGDATGTVGNSVTATNPPGGDPDPTCATCTTEHPVVLAAISVVKSADPAPGSIVAPGDTVSYTLTATITNSATTQPLTLTDTLDADLTFGSVTNSGPFTCSGTLSCVLPAGTLPGTYAVTYTATVDADATGTIGNSVTAANPPGGDPDPACTSCTTEHPVVLAAISVAKSANPGSGSTVAPGDSISYTLTATVSNSATTETVTLTDTPDADLTFGAVTSSGPFICSGTLSCILPAGTLPGTYAVTYTATVDADATGTVGNSVAATNPPGGDPDPSCTACTTQHPIVATAVSVAKTANPAAGSTVTPGDTISYTLTATVANSATTEAVTLSDTLDAGLTFGSVTNAGAFSCSGALNCVLPAGTLPGTYAVTYTATVDADATGTVGNSVTATNPPGGDPDPSCTACTTEHPIVATAVSVAKTANPGSGSTVAPGDTISYTLTATVANSATTQAVTLSDTLDSDLTFGSVTNAGPFACSGSLSCVLPAGTLPGTYSVTYTATVDADATGAVGNSVTATNPPGGDPDPACTSCTTQHPIVATAVSVAKSSNPANGSTVAPGSTIAYTLTATVANSATTEPVTLTDTLDSDLTFGSVTNAGPFACSGSLSCVLPAGTLPGTYSVIYTTTVDADATGAAGNSVTATNPPGGDPDPSCTSCSTEHLVPQTRVSISKSSNVADGAEVRAGQTIEYRLTATVENSVTTEPVTLTDTLGAGLTFGAVTDSGLFACSGSLSCEIPAGTLPGTYQLVYTATVDNGAVGSVRNSVTATNPPGGDPDPSCADCTVEHRLMAARILLGKSSNPGNGAEVKVGEVIDYRLAVRVENSATTQPVTLTDTPGPGLTIGTLPAGCTSNGTITCVLPAGATPGTYEFAYTATVNADAPGAVGNVVAGAYPPGGTVECTSCATTHRLIDKASLRIVKSTTARGVKIGDLVRYTLTIQNVGAVNVSGAVVVDTPPQGFAYVADSMSVADRDGAFSLAGNHPLRIGGIDIAAGSRTTIVYLLRVGAGVGSGTHVNEAVAQQANGTVISNLATAQVTLESDPLLEDSLIFGTVFDDRDGDGWQDKDEAGIAGVRIASVEGLLIETDQYGRYHLVDIPGGGNRGRNFILKVDPATLPQGSSFTTRNPLLRRITPGIPVRFDFGVRLPRIPPSNDPAAPADAGRE